MRIFNVAEWQNGRNDDRAGGSHHDDVGKLEESDWVETRDFLRDTTRNLCGHNGQCTAIPSKGKGGTQVAVNSAQT